MQYPTPHIHATPADFAQTVLMPGDPLRAQYIAQTYLEDAVLVNNVRGIQGYTGTYRGVRLSVMASGMGMPSMGIYSHELFCCFGVKNIIRIGSAGALQGQIQLRDLVIAQGASTDANWGNQFHTPGNLAPLADFTLLETCVSAARDLGANAHVGNVLSSQYFYTDEEDIPQALQANTAWQRMGILAIEMEAAALYLNASRYGGRALALCSVSDHILNGTSLSAQERQTSFQQMMEVALETAIRLDVQPQ